MAQAPQVNDQIGEAAAAAPKKPRREGKMSAGAVVAATAVLLLLALGGVAGLGRVALWNWADRPFGATAQVDLKIQPRSSLRDISAALESAGLASNAKFFTAYCFLTHKRNTLQAGDYRVAAPIAPKDLAELLQRGSFQRKLTIPEGWTAAKIDKEMVQWGWTAKAGEWLEIVREPVGAEYFGAEIAAGAEGFCFPDTYLIEQGTSARKIRDRMLRQFAKVWGGLHPEERDSRSDNLTLLEVVTLASMIEREARKPEELPQIASVYLNRLKINMKLQCCATVYYSLGDLWDRPLTFADLKVDSPYNTYLHKGLPPGPICNPSRDALEAVLRPAVTPFLFYVYRGDGTHEFTRTYREHMEAVKRFKESDPTASYVEPEK